MPRSLRNRVRVMTRATMLDGTTAEADGARGVVLRPVLRIDEDYRAVVYVRPSRWIRYVVGDEGFARVVGRGDRSL